MAILVSAGLSKKDLYFANYALSKIDEFYGFCREASSLGLSQGERRTTDNKEINVKRTLDNHIFGSASRLVVVCYA
jgi:hypothetical protein